MTAAVALIGGPAFADNSPSVGNVTGIANFSLLAGNNKPAGRDAGYPAGTGRPGRGYPGHRDER